MIAIGYIRVSKIEEDQRGISLEAQERSIKIYCELNNLTLQTILKDEGESGKDLKREGMQELIKLVEKKQVQAIIVYKLDRLSRNVLNTLNLIELFERKDVSFHSITEKIDTTTAIGRFFVTVIAAIAQIERDLISERTKAVLRFKRSKGERVGGISYGYNSVKKKGIAMLQVNEEEMKILKEIKIMRQGGVSYNGIATHLNIKGIKTRGGGLWYAQTIKSILEHSLEEI